MVIADRLRGMKRAKQCVRRLLNQNQNLRVQIAQHFLDELRPARRAAHDAGQHHFLEEVSSWQRECYLGPEELNYTSRDSSIAAVAHTAMSQTVDGGS
jgi:hypothetical protein